MAILVSDQMVLKLKLLEIRDEHYILVKELINQEDLTLINIYVSQ